MTARRRDGGRLIDREKPLRFTFNGAKNDGIIRAIPSPRALLANGQTLRRAQLQSTTARAASSPPGRKSPTRW